VRSTPDSYRRKKKETQGPKTPIRKKFKAQMKRKAPGKKKKGGVLLSPFQISITKVAQGPHKNARKNRLVRVGGGGN